MISSAHGAGLFSRIELYGRSGMSRGPVCPKAITGGLAKPMGLKDGRVAEWFKALVLKTSVGASPP